MADIIITRSRIPENPNNLGIFKIVKARRGDVGRKIYSIRLNNGRFIALPKEIFKRLKEDTEKRDYKVRTGIVATGDIFCTDSNMASKINRKFNALCVEMEGASIAQVAFLSHIPFLIIRSISDTPDNHNVDTYDAFLEESCKVVAGYVKEMIRRLK